jgi:hypothetical protein
MFSDSRLMSAYKIINYESDKCTTEDDHTDLDTPRIAQLSTTYPYPLRKGKKFHTI